MDQPIDPSQETEREPPVTPSQSVLEQFPDSLPTPPATTLCLPGSVSEGSEATEPASASRAHLANEFPQSYEAVTRLSIGAVFRLLVTSRAAAESDAVALEAALAELAESKAEVRRLIKGVQITSRLVCLGQDFQGVADIADRLVDGLDALPSW